MGTVIQEVKTSNIAREVLKFISKSFLFTCIFLCNRLCLVRDFQIKFLHIQLQWLVYHQMLLLLQVK